ncbi:hypothetical protein [Subtercola lobariae]|uniref:Asp23/Gls24 family envelope stress response protein n=1 Tax=Subtercola lobariae TaxID=1588641 RepID=A0A917B0L0_9MICO|nr:hypothetical protein [Subtercola lobariae]GGF10164.1 hypothetical protein GCM10011399_00040 [Subtercola lobariae]
MTPTDDTSPPSGDDLRTLPDRQLTNDELAGHTIDELIDYYDAGLMPPNDSIDTSAGCQLALADIAHLRQLTMHLVDDDSAAQPPVDEGWITSILSHIGAQVEAGRDVPVFGAEVDSRVVITEGALRAIVRAAGDRVDGVFVGRCRFAGDLTELGAPIEVEVEASMLWGQNLMQTAELVRENIVADVRRHTLLNVVAVNVVVQDVRRPSHVDEGGDGREGNDGGPEGSDGGRSRGRGGREGNDGGGPEGGGDVSGVGGTGGAER